AIREEQSMITDLVINDAIKYKDGSMLIIAEQNAVNSDKEKKISLTVEARYHYEYNDIIITKLDKHGEVLWMKRLIKKQKGGGITLKSMKESLSYKYYESLNTHYLLFLDNLK